MALLVALALAVFVLPAPWGVVAVAAGCTVEVGEALLLWRWSHRRSPAVGIERLVGSRAVVAEDCSPRGHVRVHGELWQALCAEGAAKDEIVTVSAVDGLTLIVERACA